MKRKYPFSIEAIVVLPDHLHTLWTLPPNDHNYSVRLQLMKSLFTRQLNKKGVALNKNSSGEYNLWQRRYWEHTIRDDLDRQRHIDYIHYNPVKHGLVRRVNEWPYSSFQYYVRQGILPVDWTTDEKSVIGMTLGE